jgi:glyoxylate reductase
MARRAHGFGMAILYTDAIDRPEADREWGARRVELDTLLRASDFVSVHVPLTDETRGLIGERELSLMKSTAALVNTSRGPVVDTEALVRALANDEIFAAALDVTDPEPLPAMHRLVHLPNAIVTPHIASGTEQTRSKMAELAAQNLIAALTGGQPPRCLNPEVLGHGRR